MSFETICTTAARTLDRFRSDDDGATAVEYALIASGVGAAIAATVWELGTNVKNFYTTLASLLPG
jgi:pilus assembly protein Flp/PilA